MTILRVAGVDPSLTNTGLAKFDIEIGSWAMTPISVERVITDNETREKGRKTKVVRQNSDDLRRAGEIYAAISQWVGDCDLVFAEIPSGAQSARAALAFGVVTGIMGAISQASSLIQVMPSETKKLGVGIKNADKRDVMDWAYAKFPDMPWGTMKRHGELIKTDTNEHCADACAIVAAGVQTDEFKRTATMIAAMRKKAA